MITILASKQPRYTIFEGHTLEPFLPPAEQAPKPSLASSCPNLLNRFTSPCLGSPFLVFTHMRWWPPSSFLQPLMTPTTATTGGLPCSAISPFVLSWQLSLAHLPHDPTMASSLTALPCLPSMMYLLLLPPRGGLPFSGLGQAHHLFDGAALQPSPAGCSRSTFSSMPAAQLGLPPSSRPIHGCTPAPGNLPYLSGGDLSSSQPPSCIAGCRAAPLMISNSSPGFFDGLQPTVLCTVVTP
ncbi:hypothetical protein GOP47_0018266 [Adiantum capillus-veneris]|uniref:Uncharacterized protein n=1 Tax=Adiantum capillus-veneris TaxID=13818 RepID=A0A9D4UGY2_ADICA|nr:hypothetical protein GOP47_0018266 [Adiantum capillus-veneris]